MGRESFTSLCRGPTSMVLAQPSLWCRKSTSDATLLLPHARVSSGHKAYQSSASIRQRFVTVCKSTVPETHTTNAALTPPVRCFSLIDLLKLPRFILRRVVGSTAAIGLAAALLLNSVPAGAEGEIFRFPASPHEDVYAAQRTLVEAWSIVDSQFVDRHFGGQNWEAELGDALLAAYQTDDGSKAYAEIGHMLSKLKDPFTRIVPPSEYADFRVSSDGEVQGVGLLIASEAQSGRLMVLAPIQGGPADRAGIQPGDEVLSIDGKSTKGWDGDRAAHFLRGRTGSSVNVRLARRTQQVPGVAGRPEEPLHVEYKQEPTGGETIDGEQTVHVLPCEGPHEGSQGLHFHHQPFRLPWVPTPNPRHIFLKVNLKREKLELSPVFSTAMMHDGHKLGYIRLLNFSQKAAADMHRAISRLESRNVEGFILDLRNNPGGLVRAGIDIARLWIDGPAAVFNVSGRDELANPALMQKVILEDGHADTTKPLTVLVNGNSASASEILAGALHDNHRAAVIGDRTYGKGKIQSVFELEDGSALFVTVARYKTPALQDIDQVGIQPDEACILGGSNQAPSGMPVDAEAASRVLVQLGNDSCVLTAERRLSTLIAEPIDHAWNAANNTWIR